ncbi:MAG: hypothetical protein ABMA64_02530 [Myxococcota bacterium]
MARTGQLVAGHSLQVVVSSDALTETWRAMHLQQGTLRGVRILRPEAAVHADAWRTLVERQQKLIHPCRLQVFAVADVDGLPAAVVEWVNGPSLLTWSRVRPRPINELIHVFAEVADGVSMAHDAGVLHGAIDPRRIWMKPQGGTFTPKVDLAVEALGTSLRLCPVRAPEQISNQPIDERTDLYLLGATLYEIVARNPPFDAGSTRPPSLSHVRPDAPPGLVQLVSALLEPDPGHRPESLEEVREILMAVVRGEPLPALSHGIAAEKTAVPVPSPPPRGSLSGWIAMAAGAAAVGSLATAVWLAYLA